MLTLHLALTDNQIIVRANNTDSHSFPLTDLGQTEKEWKSFTNDPRPYGTKLFQALFKDGSESRKAFDELSKQTERGIVLVLESTDLDSVAWEYAYNKAKEEYVVEDCAFVRALPESERPANGRIKNEAERVPLLFIPANPLVDLSGEPMRALDIDGEWKEMTRHIKASNAPFDMCQLQPPTVEELQTQMAKLQLIIHFSGHGAATKDGAILLFEEKNGASNPLEAREFVREVKDKAWIVFLSACQSAVAERSERRPEPVEGFSNLARGLARAGVPFVLGMQFNLPDPFALAISGQFYNHLAQGHAIPEAARQARRAVKRENEFFVGMIALYAAHPDEAGRLAWRGSGAQIVTTFREADVSDIPSPASGLIGRQRELMRIGTRLMDSTRSAPLTVTLHGAGGIGKTALLWQTLRRFAPSFELTLALALDPLPTLERILGRLEPVLNLPSPCANETKERESLVRNALTSRHALVGLDNFETLIHARDNGTDEEKKTAKSLYAFFKSLPAGSVTLCVTSREKTNLPGEHIEEIHGLDDAMGGALFYENVSTRKDALHEAGLEKLSAAVGGHPLALRLLAPVFEEQAGVTLDAFVENLQTHLPQASDEWTEQDRHASLGACFAFSMDNLPKNEEGEKLRIALTRLSLFIAFFYPIFVASVIAKKVPETPSEEEEQSENAEKISHALWERGLLERATIALPDENLYLYRLHPVMNQFAAAYIESEDKPTLQGDYVHAMQTLATIAYPTSTSSGIYGSPIITVIVRLALPDILNSLALVQDENTETSLLIYTAFIQSHFGNMDEAMNLYQRALETYDRSSDLKGKAVVLNLIAGIYGARDSLEKAMFYYEQTLEICEAAGEMQGKSNTLFEIANIFVIRGDLKAAKEHYQQALDISEKIDDQRGKSAILHDLAYILALQGDQNTAIKYYQQSLAINEMLGDLKGTATTFHDMALMFISSGDLVQAMKLSKQSLDISESLGDLKGMSDALFQTANIHKNNNNLNESMKLYKQALEIYEKLGDLKGISDASYELAYIYHVLRDYKQANNLYRKSLQLKEGLGDQQGAAMTLGMMSHVLWDCKNYKESIASQFKGFMMLLKLNTEPEVQRIMISDFKNWRKELGSEKFDALWKEEFGQPIPEWFSQQISTSSQPPLIEKANKKKKPRKRSGTPKK